MSEQSQEVGSAMWGGTDPLGVLSQAKRPGPAAPLPETTRTVDLTDLAAIVLMVLGAVATATAVGLEFGGLALLLVGGLAAIAAGVALAFRPGGDG